ncbi:MAG: hypothetical protein JWQ11_1366 [Rhizobacter sp.]|nr:hypothetical protein [Rhizobacter sp.]
MSDNDPFAAFDSERTLIKPNAGRGPRTPSTSSPDLPPLAGHAEAAAPIEALMGASLNPLVSAAAPLLGAAPRIRAMSAHPNPAGLKDALSEAIRRFESQARAAGLPNEQVVAGRYILCTLLDESAASTPWGSSGAWSAKSLLVQFHNEAWGGEKVFQLMSKLAENVPANRNLLELLYVALAFGFEGRYRVLDNGRAQLDSVRDRLAQMLAQARGETDKALSPHWQGVPVASARLRDGLPVWVVASIGALVATLLFVGLRFGINNDSDPVFASLRSLDTKVAPPPPAAPIVLQKPEAPPPPRLATFLKTDIAAGLVTVADLADKSVVTIKGDGFFEPGSAVVAERMKPLLGRIGEALNSVPGQALVVGHTDSQPIRSVRYPSNWHLSEDRAKSVAGLLGQTVKPERLRAEGRADSEPVADNATADGRSRNRRVDITVLSGPAA